MRPSVRQNRKSRPPTGIGLFANGLGKIQIAFFAAVTAKIGTFFAVRVTFCDGQTEEGTDARRAGRRGPHRVGRFELEADRRKFGRELRRYPFEEQDAEEEEGAGAASVRTAVGGWCGTARRPPLDPMPELTEHVKHRRDDQHEGRNRYCDPDTDEISPAPCYYLDGDRRLIVTLHRPSPLKKLRPFPCHRIGPFAWLPTTTWSTDRRLPPILRRTSGKRGRWATHRHLHRAFYPFDAQGIGALCWTAAWTGSPAEQARSNESLVFRATISTEIGEWFAERIALPSVKKPKALSVPPDWAFCFCFELDVGLPILDLPSVADSVPI